MHQPDLEHQIETTVDGKCVRGTVRHFGAADISVRLDHPSHEWSSSLHMPYFRRGAHPEGFLGDYGSQTATWLLTKLYKEQKKGHQRSKFAGGFTEFGRTRYLAVNPGHPGYDCRIREQARINASIYVQIEEDGEYGLARFFDTGTNQPFLAESAVYDESLSDYVDGLNADLSFRWYLRMVRRKLLPAMIESAALLKSRKLNPNQAHFLAHFHTAWQAGEIPLAADEIDQLVDLGYLTRNSGLCTRELVTLKSALERSRKAKERFEATGKHNRAVQCIGRMRKLQQRIEIKTLMITPAGKAAVWGL